MTAEFAIASDLPEQQPRDADGLNDLAKRLDIRKQDLLVLGKEADPFNTGTDGKVVWAEWFAELWRRFGFTKDVHVRRVHYRAQATGDVLLPDGEVYLNTYEHWRKLAPASNHARDLGLIDASLFEDRRNEPIRAHTWPRDEEPVPTWEVNLPEERPWRLPEQMPWTRPSFNAMSLPTLWLNRGDIDPDEIGQTTVSGYDYRRADQPYYEVLWIEKSTMNDVLEPLCRDLGVDFAAAKGFASKTLAIELLNRARRSGKPLRLFTISDFDPGGSHMATAMARHLEFYRDVFSPETEIVVRHLGMHQEWVAKYDLPRAPIEPGKSAIAQGRIDNFEARHGEGAVELDALEALHPGALDREVRALIRSYHDPDLRGRLAEVEDEAERHVSGAWHDITATVRDEIDRVRTEIDAIVERYRERLAGVQSRRDDTMAPFIERLRRVEAEATAALDPLRQEYLKTVGEYQAEIDPLDQRLDDLWTDINNLADTADIELPERPEPEVDADESDVLFDSRRHWWDQLERYRQEQGRGPMGRTEHVKHCEACGTKFTTRRSHTRACSDRCRGKLRNRTTGGAA